MQTGPEAAETPLLRLTGLVEYRRGGQEVFYFLASDQVRQMLERCIRAGLNVLDQKRQPGK